MYLSHLSKPNNPSVQRPGPPTTPHWGDISEAVRSQAGSQAPDFQQQLWKTLKGTKSPWEGTDDKGGDTNVFLDGPLGVLGNLDRRSEACPALCKLCMGSLPPAQLLASGDCPLFWASFQELRLHGRNEHRDPRCLQGGTASKF